MIGFPFCLNLLHLQRPIFCSWSFCHDGIPLYDILFINVILQNLVPTIFSHNVLKPLQDIITSLNLARFLFTAANQLKGPIQPRQQRRCINCTQYTLATIGEIHTRLIYRCVAGFTVQICTKAAKQTRFPVGP